MDSFYFQVMLNGLMLGLIYVLIASGFSLIFGIMNVVNFAHGEIYMLGSFLLYFLFDQYHVNFFLAMLLSILALGCLGVVLERIFFRKYRDSLFITFLNRFIQSSTPRRPDKTGFTF